ncbi:MAG TPA: hypothetical protein VH079_08125 [Terriglobales bacterium]|nr:hypothetical protein [Terriglobales bacterium]
MSRTARTPGKAAILSTIIPSTAITNVTGFRQFPSHSIPHLQYKLFGLVFVRKCAQGREGK